MRLLVPGVYHQYMYDLSERRSYSAIKSPITRLSVSVRSFVNSSKQGFCILLSTVWSRNRLTIKCTIRLSCESSGNEKY
jgi:hypothetical protein